MKTKHTAGPWSVNRKVNRFVDAGPNGDGLITICDCDPIDEMTPAQAEANARLIATAPELLEALELLFNEVSFYNEKEVFPEPEIIKSGFAVTSWNKAKAALAKAKGETI